MTTPSAISTDSLAASVVAFSRLLKDHGFAVSLPTVMDALRGVSCVGVFSGGDFKTVMKASFMTRIEEARLFDRLFAEFWIDPPAETEPTPGDGPDRGQEPTLDGPNSPFGDTVLAEAAVSHAQEQEARHASPYVIYSPREIMREQDFEHIPDGADHRIARWIKEILCPLTRRMSRRRRPAHSGSGLDFRRLLRANVRYGGEIFELPRVRPKPRVRKIVFLCDVSGSMNPYLRFMLRFIKEIQKLPTQVETFVFATRLSRVTSLLAHLPFTRAIGEVAKTVGDWHGGTRIGSCLQQFTTLRGGSMLRSSTVVLIFSDGWDRGDPSLLKREMTTLHLRCYRVLWINPLLGGSSYEPTCRGMKTALPFVDFFLPGHNLASLERLTGTLRGIL